MSKIKKNSLDSDDDENSSKLNSSREKEESVDKLEKK